MDGVRCRYVSNDLQKDDVWFKPQRQKYWNGSDGNGRRETRRREEEEEEEEEEEDENGEMGEEKGKKVWEWLKGSSIDVGSSSEIAKALLETH